MSRVEASAGDEPWAIVHEALERNFKQRAALDADEARWLREAEQLQIWKPFAMVNMVDYLERTLGYAPRTAQERLRVARALGELPELTDALSTGELAFSAVKELARVATPNTEGAWRSAARAKNLRQIEEMVAGHRPGDLPTDPPDDEARLHVIRFDEVTASVFALMRQARQSLDQARGQRLSDDEVVRAFASAVLAGLARDDSTDAAGDDGPARSDVDHRGDGPPPSQIALTVCKACDRAWQDAAGVQVPVDAATLAQARCDAEHIGSIDAHGKTRATQSIPPAVRRHVFRRDHRRCQTPGCRSSWGLEIHHIVARADGGSHDPSNLTLRCGSCHGAHHRGLLLISGTAPNQIVTTRVNAIARSAPHHRRSQTEAASHLDPDTDTEPNRRLQSMRPTVPLDREVTQTSRPVMESTRKIGRSSKLDHAIARTNAIAALTTAGWKRGIAAAAVDEACAHVGVDAPFEVLVRESFRRCPKRTG